MAGTKKNQKAKKPAVAKSAAGSNNKRAKNAHQAGTKHQNSKPKSAANQKKTQKKSVKPAAKSVSKSKKEKVIKHKKTAKDFLDTVSKAGSDVLSFIKKSGRKGIIAAACALAVIAAVIVLAILNKNIAVPDYVKNAEFKGRTEPEAVAFDMDISESQQKALVKATKVKGDKHKFDFFVNDSVVMNEYDDPALIEFGSADSNDCVLVFYILDENGNELYRSLGVEPGRQIRSVSFFDEISYGTHEATIAVLGYNPKTYKPVGMQTASIKLEIGVD